MRKASWLLAITLLLVTGGIGLYNGSVEYATGATHLQRSVSVAGFLQGLFGVIAAVGLARRRPWSVYATAAWAVCMLYTASVASFAYHDPTFANTGTATGVAMAAIVVALIGAAVVWAARVATRTPNLPRAPRSGDIPAS
jgi:peptidoglycan/LPS O-acetylase OafA/YrhL